MRCWHKDLISVLPRQQLMGQWRECCLIAKEINDKGTPNHILVNKIMDYPLSHFIAYTQLVYGAMLLRKYDKIKWKTFSDKFDSEVKVDEPIRNLFPDWHNNRYLQQCYYNLQEKYDCNGISEDEWKKIEEKYHLLMKG